MADVAFTNILVTAGSYVSTAQDLGFTSAGNDLASGANVNTFTATDNDLLIVFNSTGGSLNLLITPVADAKLGRVTTPNPLSIAIATLTGRMFGPFKKDGWADTNGVIRIAASAAGVRAVIIRPS
jgi:hypothetical protein